MKQIKYYTEDEVRETYENIKSAMANETDYWNLVWFRCFLRKLNARADELDITLEK